MVEHLVDRAHDAGGREGRDAEHHEAEVRHRRVGDQLLQVGLHQRDEGAVDDADHREDAHERREAHRRVREERDGEPEEAVAAHLQQHAGQDHRARGRGLDVRVGQPGVERPHRHLDREGEGAGQEEPGLERRVQRRGDELRDVEAREPGARVEHQERHQHQHAARERVEEELDRGVDPPLVAPDPDEEVHRDEHGLPEHVEEEEVLGHEDPDHPRLEQQHEDHELAHPLLDRAPGAEEAERGEERGQDHEPQRQAVDADVVADAPGRDPGALLAELQPGHVPEPGHQPERQREGGAGDEEAEGLLQRLRLAPGEGHEDGPRHRQEDQQAQQVGVHGAHDQRR